MNSICTLIILAVLMTISGCSSKPNLDRSLRLINPSDDFEVSDIQVFLDETPLGGNYTATIFPKGIKTYGGIQSEWGDMKLVYKYEGASEPTTIIYDLAARFGADYGGVVQITFVSANDVKIEKSTNKQ